jgi:hypothetical protein
VSARTNDGVRLGPGTLKGKGVYAARDFEAGETVVWYHLSPLTQNEADELAPDERCFVHDHEGTLYLYSEPERYVNSSPAPNTRQDLEVGRDVAVRAISPDEAITTDPRFDED